MGQRVQCAMAPSDAYGTSSTDEDQSREEHRGDEACPGEVGVGEPERYGGSGHEHRTEGLAEAQDGAVGRDEGVPVLVRGGLVRSEKAGERLRLWATSKITVGTRSSHT